MLVEMLTEQRALKVSLTHPKDPGLVSLFRLGAETAAGVTVTEDTALNFSAVYAATRCISETLAGLPAGAYRLEDSGDKELMKDHQVTRLLSLRPNGNMTPFVFRETMQAYLLLWGNAYAEIERNRLGEPIALWPRHPSRVEVNKTDGGELIYTVHPVDGAGGQVDVPARDMLHIPCLGSGECGVSVVQYARQSLGLSLAAEQLGAAFFGNGMNIGGLLKLGMPATREKKREIARQWAEEYGGGKNANKLAVIDHTADYQSLGIPPDDAQFLETRLFQAQEVCRWFRVPPTKIYDFSKATYSNIEEINKAFASESILPWARKWNQELRRKLIDEDEQDGIVVEHDVSTLVEGDLDTQTQIFSRGRQWGWYSANDVRRKLGENTIGPDGDIYLQPGNMEQAGEPEDEQQPTGPQIDTEGLSEELQAMRDDTAAARREAAQARTAALKAIYRKWAAKERAEVRAAIKRPGWAEKMDKWFGRQQRRLADELRAHCDDADQRAASHVQLRGESLLRLAGCSPDSLLETATAVVDQWVKLADKEAIHAESQSE